MNQIMMMIRKPNKIKRIIINYLFPSRGFLVEEGFFKTLHRAPELIVIT